MYNEEDIAGIKEYMLKNKQTLSFAESVTSGHLQAAMSLAEGATNFFQGGITAYNVGQKARHLHVDPIHALRCNCISEKTTAEMALHALALFSSDWAIGVTGYAAPVPDLGVHNLFAYYAIAYENKIIKEDRIDTTEKGMLKVQLHYSKAVLHEFYQVLTNKK